MNNAVNSPSLRHPGLGLRPLKLSAASFDQSKEKNRSVFPKAFKPESRFSTHLASENSPDVFTILHRKPPVLCIIVLGLWVNKTQK